MPGIAGMVTRLPGDLAEPALRQMAAAMHREDFYDTGVYSDPDNAVHIAWTTHRGSFADCMPIFNERRDVILFLAGEMFPAGDEIASLRRHHEFQVQNASYLVHAYEEAGEAFFGTLNGWFSGFLIDRRQRRCFLFNDRYGMGRIFCHETPDGLFFASEAKALLAALPGTRDFDPTGLAEMLSCHCTIGERSLYKDISVLPGASLLEFRYAQMCRKTRYFDVAKWESQPALSHSEFSNSFTATLSRLARACADGPSRVGISLTGGLDSRMVLSALNTGARTLSCYTFGSMYRDTYDVHASQQLAQACRLPHHTLELGEDFLRNLPEWLDRAIRVSDGYMGLGGAAELYLNAAARGIAPVRLTGNYGSEVLRGVRAFKSQVPRGGFLRPDFDPWMQIAQARFRETTLRHPVSFAAFQQAPQQDYGRSAVEQSQVVLRTPFLHNELLALVYRRPSTLDGFALAEATVRSATPSLLAIPTDRGYLGAGGHIRRKARRIWRQALFKAEYWTNYGMPDWLLRETALRGFVGLDRLFLGRHKFSHFRPWLRDRLQEQVRSVLLGDREADLTPYVNPVRLEQMLQDHYADRANYTNEIDLLLTVALTRKLLLGEPVRSEESSSEVVALRT